MLKIYVTEMLRFGSLESHHYIIGAFSKYEDAKYAGQVEQNWRGGNKYEYSIREIELDDWINEYTTKEKIDYYEST